MGLRRWSRIVVPVTTAFVAGCLALLGFYFGWHTILAARRGVWYGETSQGDMWLLLLILLTIFLLIAVAVVNAVLSFCFVRKVMRPLERAVVFAEALSRSEAPDVLISDGCDEDIAALQKSLNVLRDRQQNQLARNRQNSARAIKAGRERDRFESLKRRAFDGILPDAQRTLGILKGQLLIQLMEFDRAADPARKYYRDLLIKSIRRQGALARDLEAAVDISRLDWKRWNDPVCERFDVADFLYELLESVRVLSRSREVLLTSEISLDIPSRLCADRELLFYLLSVLLRAACRQAAPGSEVVFKGFRDERGEALFALDFSLRDRTSRRLARSQYESDALDLALEIVRSTARVIGCEVDVSIGEGKAVVRLSLPVGASIYDRSGITTLPPASLFAANRADVDDKTLRVLLLDDEPDSIEAFCEIMRTYHLDMTSVCNENEMLQKLREEKFDAIIVTPPFADRANGALIETIRAEQAIPVVLTSPAFPDEDERKLDFTGRTAYLAMPLNYELLNEVIRRLCR